MKIPKAFGLALPFIGGASALAMTVVVTTTVMLTYMSDVVKNTSTLTAQIAPVQDTLDISGSYQVYLNGSATPEATNSVDLVPGDVAVVKATITNNGNASAWVRDTVDTVVTHISGGTIPEFIVARPGEFTAANFEDMKTNGFPALVGYTYSFMGANSTSVNRFGVSSAKVLNGTGTNAQIETESNAPSTLIADTANGYSSSIFIGSNITNVVWSFYFDPDVVGVEDGDTYSINASTQAMQYRGYNATMPSQVCEPVETCVPFWNAVVTSPIGL